MRKLLVSLVVSLAAVPFLASSACSSSGSSCGSKVCPNDPDPTQAQIDQCNANKMKQDSKCSSQCGSYASCLSDHAKDVCGADGKTDPNKTLTLVTVTCKPTSECTTCLQTM